LIVAGRVTVNGAVAADTPGMRVTATDQVQLDGQTVRWAQQVLESPAYDYIKYWKPLGVICTTDRRIAGNILDTIELTDTLGKLPSRRIYPVGRLDKDTSGLILLTSDGRLPNSVLRGAQKQPKTYRVQVHKPLTVAALEALAAGVVITTQAQRDGKRPPALTARTLPCTCLQIADQTLEITLREGRNRQVRKMLEAVGYQVLKLHRTTFMGMDLAELQGPGDWSRLSAADEQDVVNAIEMQQAQMQPSGDDANDDEEDEDDLPLDAFLSTSLERILDLIGI
jgi:pseudouridine synthase